jgi:hypothetical protein
LLRQSLTARRAAAIIAAFTLIITVGGGILERVFDRQEFRRSEGGCGLRYRRSRRSAMGMSPPSTRTDGSSVRS